MEIEAITSMSIARIRLFGISSIVLGELVFALIYSSVGATKTMTRLAHTASVVLGMSFAFSMAVALFPDGNFSSMHDSRGFVEMHGHPVSVAIQVAGNLMFLALLLHSFIEHGKYPDSMISELERKRNRQALVLFSAGCVAEMVNLLVIPELSSAGAAFNTVTLVLSRALVAIGYVVMGIQVAGNPLLLFNVKGVTRHLLEDGVVGWDLAVMREMGPTMISTNEKFSERHGIGPKEMITFSAAALTAVGMGESFRDAVFIIPFPYHDDLFSICVSFQHHDPEIVDPRLQGLARCVFALIIPSILLRDANSFVIAGQVVATYAKKHSSVTELADTSVSAEIANALLSAIV